MERSMLTVGGLATLGVIASAVLGYLLASPEDAALRTHILVALVATLLAVFSHSWILLYLLGTGTAIRGAVRSGGFDPGLSRRTRRFKAFVYLWVPLAVAGLLAVFALGAAAMASYVPASYHHVAFYAALLVQAVALWAERRALLDNERLLLEVDGLLAGAAA